MKQENARKSISVVMPIIIINIAIYLLQLIMQDSFTGPLILKQGDLLHAPWTLITSMFLHATPLHIFFNMYVLLMFGPMLESKIGPLRFTLAYFATGIFASVVSQFFYPASLGASGAIMGILGIIIILMPHLPVVFFFFIPMPLWIAGIVIAAVDILGALGVGIQGIANWAHLAGLSLGLVIGLLLNKQKKHFYKKFTKTSEMDDSDIDEYLRSGRI
jgi:membrane associated rhomboid family serine protease